jgi:parallel beta-helix repeat protein
MRLTVDGVLQASWSVTAESWTDYSATIPVLPGGRHTVKVSYPDNFDNPPVCERNLRVDKVTLMPAADTSTDPPPEPTPSPDPVSDDADYGDPSKPTCDNSLQSLINAASPGSVVVAPGGCVYRETVTVTKPLALEAASGAEIRGSNVWSNWNQSGSYWLSGSAVPEFTAHGKCEEGTSRCLWPEQVFFDGKPLQQVASDPHSGQFAVNDNRQVILADNPSDHKVEVTVRQQWVVGKSHGVTIEGFTMKHAANDSQSKAAVANGGYSNWTVQNNVLSDAHGAVVSLTDGTGLKLIGNDIFRGGQLGVHSGGGAELVVEDNKIHHNNTEGFSRSWEAGGMKAAAMSSLRVEGNEVYANGGVGLWCDVGCKNVVYSNNRIHHNENMGILIEISSGAQVFGNVLWENGWAKSAWGWGAGIVSSSSKDVEIYNNTLAWNADGISVISQERNVTYALIVENVLVHDNQILAKDYPGTKDNFALAWLQDWDGGVLFDASSNNRGYDNRYWYPSAEGSYARYKWNREPERFLEPFNATLGEETGSYMTKSEKDTVVSSTGIPAEPEH